MSEPEPTDLTTIIAAHERVLGMRLATCMCGWEEPIRGRDVTALHRAHVVAAIREARTVRTVGELDALPDGSVYVSDLHPDVPETKARGCWWTAGHDPYEPSLPGRCVYRPDEDGE